MRMKEDLIKRIENKEVQYAVRKVNSRVFAFELIIPVLYCGQCMYHQLDTDNDDEDICKSSIKMICVKEHRKITSCLNFSDLDTVEIPKWCPLTNAAKEANGSICFFI